MKVVMHSLIRARIKKPTSFILHHFLEITIQNVHCLVLLKYIDSQLCIVYLYTINVRNKSVVLSVVQTSKYLSN